MHRSVIIRHLLAIFVIVGLVIGPLTVPVAAGPIQTLAVAEAMPCCPKKPVPLDCQKCPLGLLCMSKGDIGVLASIVMPPLAFTTIDLISWSDRFREGLGHAPPARPPRFLV